MKYLIDTNVISELIKEQPDKKVVKCLSNLPSISVYLSVFTWGELRKGVEKLPASEKKKRLTSWLEKDLNDWFKDRILPFDVDVAERWGKLLAEVKRSVSVVDSLIAATALYHGANIVTRNTKDFNYPGLVTINPFEEIN